MPSAAQLRTQIEHDLAHKAPSALTPSSRAIRATKPTGVAQVDELLEGGLPIGAISEFTGPACSGRVSLALALVAGQTRAGQVCAWVDAGDGFDPQSAQASGVELERLLWVRCGPDASASLDSASAGSRFAVQKAPETAKGCIGMHPRMEERGLASAIEGLLELKTGASNSGKPGTPSAQNRPLAAVPQQLRGRVEQVASDRLPARRGEHALEQKSRLAAGQNGVVDRPDSLAAHAAELARVAPRCAETQQGFGRAMQARVTAMNVPQAPAHKSPRPAGASPWDRLDQAIRTTDLLLQGGGFSCIVMDLSGVEAEFANRIPLATWFRFRAAADRTRASLVVLTRHACTGSSGEVLLKMQAGVPEGSTVMASVPLVIERMRQRFTGSTPALQAEVVRESNLVTMRKPPRSVTKAGWSAACASLKAAGVAL